MRVGTGGRGLPIDEKKKGGKFLIYHNFISQAERERGDRIIHPPIKKKRVRNYPAPAFLRHA